MSMVRFLKIEIDESVLFICSDVIDLIEAINIRSVNPINLRAGTWRVDGKFMLMTEC
jgi:hypothetical protein